MRKTPLILIVDDVKSNLMILRATLAKEGYQVSEAMSGQEAFELAASQAPDLIMMDMMMPGESGAEACVRLKKNHSTADIPVIFVSASDQVESKLKAFDSGAVDYVTKPYWREEVLARVRIHLKLARAFQELTEVQAQKLGQLTNAQKSLLVNPADMPEANFSVCFCPHEEAGGDFYDVTEIGDGIFGYFVADVSGHDIEASFTTSALKALFRQNATPLNTPAETLKAMNSVLNMMMTGGRHLTACYATLNRKTRTLKIATAGHLPMLVRTKEGQCTFVESAGSPLGAFEHLILETEQLKLKPGDRFYLYSDGLVESAERSMGREEGMARLKALVESTDPTPMGAACKTIADAATGGASEDDVVLLAVEV